MSRLEEILRAARRDTEDAEFAGPRAWKEAADGRAAVGFFPVYVPEELLWAAGALPVAIWGAGDGVEVELADARVQSFICSISRSSLELGLTGRLDFLDGMLFGSLCDVARNLSGVWARNFPAQFVDYLHFPQNPRSPRARSYYREELQRLGRELGAHTGHPVTEEGLNEAIEVYERQRALLRDLLAIREREPWALGLDQLVCLMRSSGRRDPHEQNALLEEAVELLDRQGGRSRDGVRVVLEGSFCEQPALDLLRGLDQAHCFVVDSDLARGVRWFREPLARSGDPWSDLVEAYFRHAEASVVRHTGPAERSRRLVERARAARADGVIFCIAKFCEPAFYDFVLQKRALDEAGIPYVAVEFEEKMGSFESVRTQAETFAESILFFAEEVTA